MEHDRIVTYAHRYKSRPHHRLVVWGICWLSALAASGPPLGADTFDGVYTGKRALTKGPGPQCPPLSEDVSVTIHGDALTFTNGALRNFSIGFDPHQDGSFSEISTPTGGASVLIEGRIVGDDLDADVTNGPCEHHWHLKKSRPK
jgi:hypothetical protein